MTEDQSTAQEPFQKITLADEGILKPKLRLYITIIITVFVGTLIFIDQLLGLWPIGFYLILFAVGLIVCSIFIWILLRWDKRTRKEGDESFLEKWGDEIGWPLMVLAFTLQFLIPQIRPLLFGAIIGGSWFLVFWKR
ncbi:MAG: hypothetical protein ACFFDU_01885 [Candidatus Thorarchaeota archaeon]